MSPPLRIMIVDDDPDGRFLLEHRLRTAFKDCSVVACTAPGEALGMLRAGGFDAIITDNELGWESGAEFITQLRRRGVGCPILMVTSSDDPKVQRDAYAAGATKIFMGGRGDFPEFLRHLLGGSTAARATIGGCRVPGGRDRCTRLSADRQFLH